MRLSVDGQLVTDLRSLKLRSGDTVVVECVDHLGASQTDRVRQHVQRLAPECDIKIADGCAVLRFTPQSRG